MQSLSTFLRALRITETNLTESDYFRILALLQLFTCHLKNDILTQGKSLETSLPRAARSHSASVGSLFQSGESWKSTDYSFPFNLANRKSEHMALFLSRRTGKDNATSTTQDLSSPLTVTFGVPVGNMDNRMRPASTQRARRSFWMRPICAVYHYPLCEVA